MDYTDAQIFNTNLYVFSKLNNGKPYFLDLDTTTTYLRWCSDLRKATPFNMDDINPMDLFKQAIGVNDEDIKTMGIKVYPLSENDKKIIFNIETEDIIL